MERLYWAKGRIIYFKNLVIYLWKCDYSLLIKEVK